jgi:hypothetical protein
MSCLSLIVYLGFEGIIPLFGDEVQGSRRFVSVAKKTYAK